MERLETQLNVEPGHTSADGFVTLEAVNCVGACALGPVVIVDDEYHGQMSAQKADRLVKRMKKEG
jgi:NADH-quinone oxidoreductase subunit E